ncbi:ankyrin repeat domain-containing protein [Aspergillus tanneri]|uniref:Uncharacterized protein n=1 Tax=Aspergillus tanneri TaxID=1220188 RepID=A0A5M9MLC4_9EURO|nr:uncharacterized protein ATNIH1004_007192 [Aspergillus tanneri]KAA8645773.1 hypothetical protein ATNIH1004_007192 [Aspergillus tanneri]
MIPEDEIVPQVVHTFKLLLAGNPSTINVQDKGRTVLHYAVASHAGCRSSHSNLAIHFLCEIGADAGLKDCKGQTVLHVVAFDSVRGDPIDTDLIDLLVAHGANRNHAHKDGITALHITARNLRQVKAARFLVSRGANVGAKKSKGEHTPPWRKLRNEIIGVLQEAAGKAV